MPIPGRKAYFIKNQDNNGSNWAIERVSTAHSKVSSRRNWNRILSIPREDGTMSTNYAEVKGILLDHFKKNLSPHLNNVYVQPYPGYAYLNNFISKSVDLSHEDSLIAPITAQERKDTLELFILIKVQG